MLYGGRSVEREVSRVSARTIVAALDRSKYDVLPLAVGEDGRFLSAADSARLLAEGPVPEPLPPGGAGERGGRPARDFAGPRGRRLSDHPRDDRRGRDPAGVPRLPRHSLRRRGRDRIRDRHGQGGLQVAPRRRRDPDPAVRGRPLVGSRSAARERVCRLPLPLFVKPATGGSSVGVGKVKDLDRLDDALTEAFRYDDRALVEEGIDARELECAVLGDEEPRASVPGEIVPGHEFYDYDDKYRDDKAKLRIPAPVSEAVSDEIRRLAVESFRLCGISGMARVDFFLERGTDRVLVNELNTLPGFTAISMYPKLWEASGFPLPRC